MPSCWSNQRLNRTLMTTIVWKLKFKTNVPRTCSNENLIKQNKIELHQLSSFQKWQGRTDETDTVSSRQFSWMLFVKDFVARFIVKSNSFSFPLFQISCSRADRQPESVLNYFKGNFWCLLEFAFSSAFELSLMFAALKQQRSIFSFGWFVGIWNQIAQRVF